MADFPKFTVVYSVGASSGLGQVAKFNPYAGSAGSVVAAHSILGVSMTDAESAENLTVLRAGYMRGLGADDITGWEPSDGALLWCDTNGTVTATRPTTGLQVCIGTYLGGGVDVNVHVLPSIGDLSYVSRVSPAQSYVFVWDELEGAYVPRQLTSEDIIDWDFTRSFMFLGD